MGYKKVKTYVKTLKIKNRDFSYQRVPSIAKNGKDSQMQH